MAGTTTTSFRHRNGSARHNVGTADRVMSGLLGAWMIAGTRRRGFGRALSVAGGMMLLGRAASGHSRMYERLGVSSASLDEGAGINVEQSITIGRPLHEVYAFLRDFENLPRAFSHLTSVTVGPGGLSHIATTGRRGRTVGWDVLLNDHPDEYISWESAEDAAIQQAGSVHFREAPGGRGTEVHVKLRYRPPGGAWGFGAAKLLNPVTTAQLGADLHQLKQLLETQSVTTTEGQPTGPTRAELAAEERERTEAERAAAEAAEQERQRPRSGRVREPMPHLNAPEPVVTKGYELEPSSSRQIEGAPVPALELDRVFAGSEGVDAARPASAVDEDYRGGGEL